jgi:hypothetical protein
VENVKIFKAFYVSYKGYIQIPITKKYIRKNNIKMTMKMHKSDYIKYSRAIVRKLHHNGCYGTGSMYEDNVVKGLPDISIAKKVLEALVKQSIACKKKKEHGWKYYLNMDRYDKIREIIKETGKESIIPILLLL